jgi:hypothetical protein
MTFERLVGSLFLACVVLPAAAILSAGISALFWALASTTVAMIFAGIACGVASLWATAFVGLVLSLAWDRLGRPGGNVTTAEPRR